MAKSLGTCSPRAEKRKQDEMDRTGEAHFRTLGTKKKKLAYIDRRQGFIERPGAPTNPRSVDHSSNNTQFDGMIFN